MKASLLKIYAAKLSVFIVMLLYIATDLFIWHGPLWHLLHGKEKAVRPANVVATVYGEDITREQLAHHTAEQDKLAGRTQKEPSRRASRLLEMVRATGIRIRARYNDRNLPDFHQEAEAEVARLATRAESDEAFAAQLESQGYTRESFTHKVESRLKAQAQLERAIAPYCEVTDEAVAAHYEKVKGELTIPDARRVHHIFLSTLHRNKDEVKAHAEVLLEQLKDGVSFETLAAEASEDARTADQGGDLGLIYDVPTRPLPCLPLFGRRAMPSGEVYLAESTWGWHILIAGEILPAHTATLDECRESIRTAIVSAQRELAVRSYFKAAIQDARQRKRIQIHVP